MSKKTEEENLQPKIPRPGISTLPTAWIKLDVEGNIIERFCTKDIPEGHDHWLLAKCHYEEGKEDREFYTKPLNKVAEALLVREDPEEPGLEQLRRRWVYGVRIPLRDVVKSTELGGCEDYESITEWIKNN